MKILLLITLLILTVAGCEDKIVKKDGDIIRRDNLCSDPSPETEPSQYMFEGIDSVSNVTQTSVQLNWNHIPGFKFYHVLSYTRTGRNILKTVEAPQKMALIKNLIPDTEYRFLVRAMDEHGFIDANANIITVRTSPWPNYLNQKSISFNGNQSINIGPSSNFKKTDKISLSFWIKADLSNVSDEVRLINFHKGANAASALSIGVNKTEIILTHTDAADQLKTFSKEVTFNDNSWHHIAFTSNKDSFKLYVDGQSIAFIRDAVKGFGAHAAHLGAYTGSQKGYVGLMDEVLISNVYLSAKNISALYSSRATHDPRDFISSNKIISWYRMGDSNIDGPQQIEDIIGTNTGFPLNMTSSNIVLVKP